MSVTNAYLKRGVCAAGGLLARQKWGRPSRDSGIALDPLDRRIGACHCFNSTLVVRSRQWYTSRYLKNSPTESICLSCGLCCNGVIFADLKLQPQDDPVRLEEFGLPLKRRVAPKAIRVCQPCAAFEDCRCRFYAERPQYCREFECLLLKRLQSGRTDRAAALRVIRAAHQRADKVRRLLEALGDADSQTALATRFRRTSKRMEQGDLDEATAETYARLTLAVHDLNLLLCNAFYPGSLTEVRPPASAAAA
jgi:uncharacterized protein